jgi:hypothetical protein
MEPSVDLRDPEVPVGPRVLASAVALLTIVLPFAADWNATHLYNPAWSGHAKFHSAHTMALGAALGLLGLVWLWRRGSFGAGLGVLAIYWLTQASALAFPGTAVIDPEFAERLPRLGGLTLNQLWGDALFVALLAISLAWARRRGGPSGARGTPARGPSARRAW